MEYVIIRPLQYTPFKLVILTYRGIGLSWCKPRYPWHSRSENEPIMWLDKGPRPRLQTERYPKRWGRPVHSKVEGLSALKGKRNPFHICQIALLQLN